MVQKICADKKIFLCVPVKRLRRLYYKKAKITAHRAVVLRRKIREIELAQNKLAHVKSVVETLLLRNYE